MKPQLYLHFFGVPQFTRQETSVNGFISDKARALLIYLAVTGRAHSRDTLSDLLWANTPATKRKNLKKALSNLRKMEGIVLVEEGYQTVALDTKTYWLDVHEFSTLAHPDLLKTLAEIERAASFYQADFLTGFNISLSLEFEEWALVRQSQLRMQMADALHWLADIYLQRQMLPKAVETLRQLLNIEPWQEEVHRKLMELLARNGDISGALGQYKTCCEHLRAELDIEPSQATLALVAEIRSGEFTTELANKFVNAKHGSAGRRLRIAGDRLLPPAHLNNSNQYTDPLPQFVAGPPITQPHLFFGRNEEVTRIFGWWQAAPMAHVALIGPRRSGKTSLLRYLNAIVNTNPAQLRPNQKQDWLPSPQAYRWLQIDFQDPRMRSQERLLRHMLTGFGLDAPAECSLETFMDIAECHQWSLPVIVLMDELGAGLAAPELDQAFWWMLRALSQSTEGYLAFMIAAHDQPMKLAEDQGKTSPFFNIFTTLNLGPLTQEEAHELIGCSPIFFADTDVAWILEESGRWPYLLQILCQERLRALEVNDQSEDWHAAAQERIEPFLYLRDNHPA